MINNPSDWLEQQTFRYFCLIGLNAVSLIIIVTWKEVINSAGSKKSLREMFAVSQYPSTLKKKSIKNIQQVEVYQIEFSD